MTAAIRGWDALTHSSATVPSPAPCFSSLVPVRRLKQGVTTTGIGKSLRRAVSEDLSVAYPCDARLVPLDVPISRQAPSTSSVVETNRLFVPGSPPSPPCHIQKRDHGAH